MLVCCLVQAGWAVKVTWTEEELNQCLNVFKGRRGKVSTALKQRRRRCETHTHTHTSSVSIRCVSYLRASPFAVTLWLSDLDNESPGEDLRWCQHTVRCVSAAGGWTEVNSPWSKLTVMLRASAAISGPQRDAGAGRPALGGEAQEGLWADESALRTQPPWLQGLGNRQKHTSFRPTSCRKDPPPNTTAASLTRSVILQTTVNDFIFEISICFNPGGQFLNVTLTEGHKLELWNFFSFLKANTKVCFFS